MILGSKPGLYYETPEFPLTDQQRADLRSWNIYPIRNITRENLSLAAVQGFIEDIGRASLFSNPSLVVALPLYSIIREAIAVHRDIPLPEIDPIIALIDSAIADATIGLIMLASEPQADTDTVLDILRNREAFRLSQSRGSLDILDQTIHTRNVIAEQKAKRTEEIRSLFNELNLNDIDSEGKFLLEKLQHAYRKDDREMIQQAWIPIIQGANKSLLDALKQEKFILAKAIRDEYIELSEEIPAEHLCPIGGYLMVQPIEDPTAENKQFYEQSRITSWLYNEQISPITRLPWDVHPADMTVNETKQTEILNWVVKAIESEQMPSLEGNTEQSKEYTEQLDPISVDHLFSPEICMSA